MKFKDIDNNKLDSYIEDVRFNRATYKNHFAILNGQYNEEKKYAGIISILSIYVKEMKLENKSSKEILEQIFNEKNEIISQTSKYKIYDVIRFVNDEYLILNVIDINKNTYLYLINNNKEYNDTSVIKVIKDKNNNCTYDYIEDDEEFENVVNKIVLSYENEIKELFD